MSLCPLTLSLLYILPLSCARALSQTHCDIDSTLGYTCSFCPRYLGLLRFLLCVVMCVMGLARREKSEMEADKVQLEEDVDSLERQVCVCVCVCVCV